MYSQLGTQFISSVYNTFACLLYHEARLYRSLKQLRVGTLPGMISQHVYSLCRRPETVTAELKRQSDATPADIINTIYAQPTLLGQVERSDLRNAEDVAAECGSWNTRPSSLFLRAFSSALNCLDSDAFSGMVSPPLMGSDGIMPSTMIAPLVDIVRHCAKLIESARHEVFFVTCVWSPSIAQRAIKEALVNLSVQAGQRDERVLVRIVYDQAGASHLLDAHQLVQPSSYTSPCTQLPSPSEVPNLDIQVMSVHTVMLGTLHAKVCVVDGDTALIMSNNIEDNGNLEMMTHLRGQIVAGIYDSLLITWNKRIVLPTAAVTKDIRARDFALHELMMEVNKSYEEPNAVSHKLDVALTERTHPTGPPVTEGNAMAPYIFTVTENPVPMALVCRPPHGGPDSRNVQVPQNQAWLGLVDNAQHSVFIQTPDLNASFLLPALAAALKRGVNVTYYVCFGYNDAGEMLPGQGGTNEQAAAKLISLADGYTENLHIYNYVAKDQDHPIHHSLRSRSCHIKLMIVDGMVGVQGSGNQDTQSWCHSHEMNIMVDSAEICNRWREGIERNQNTRHFGRVSPDGIWRDDHGQPGKGYSGNPGVLAGLFHGAMGMVKKTMRQKSAR